MKKITLLVFGLWAALHLAACSPATPLARVMLEPTGEEGGDAVYQTVYDNGKTKETDAFSPEAERFTAVYGDFSCEIVNGKVINTLIATRLTNSAGEEGDADDTQKALLLALADEIDHDMAALSLFTAGTRHFAYVQLNVNWSSPGILYEYDSEAGRLSELARWDSYNLTGLSLPEEPAAK